MNPVFVDALSVFGPGLQDWSRAQAILSGRVPYQHAPTDPVDCGYLTPNIKRRTTLHMQVAFHVAEKALLQSNLDPTGIELLFATSEGDLFIADRIFHALMEPEKMVSPQHFQNVILNAAVGHFGIVLGNRSSATSVTGGEYSFAVGLLQAVASVVIEQRPVLFVNYDVVVDVPVDPRCRDGQPFGVALLLTPEPSPQAVVRLDTHLLESDQETKMEMDMLEQVRCSLGAARSLPLLVAMAGAGNSAVMLPYCESTKLRVELSPCRP